MIRDIYIRSPQDPLYQFGVYEHDSPIESIISKIKMILGTRQGQVLDDMNFGVGLEDLIFESRINKLDLEEKIKDQIYQYIDESKDFQIRPSVQFGRSMEGYDFALVDIYINEIRSVGILVK
jgi:hypothetical protein